jgi:hypothetical protein
MPSRFRADSSGRSGSSRRAVPVGEVEQRMMNKKCEITPSSAFIRDSAPERRKGIARGRKSVVLSLTLGPARWHDRCNARRRGRSRVE